jgi:tetratricopeptide (TPR) repeat protein
MPKLTRRQAWISGACAVVFFLGYPAFEHYNVDERILAYLAPQSVAGPANLRGTLLRVEGKLDEAIAEFDKAIRLTPDWYLPYAERGVVYRMKGDYDRSIADLGRAIALRGEWANGRYERAVTYRAKGDLDSAVADLGEAVRINPGMADAYFVRAAIAHERGDRAGAMADLDQAISRRGDKADWFLARATIALFELDRPTQAADDFAQAARAALKYRSYIKMLDGGEAKLAATPSAEMMDFKHAFLPDGLYLFLWAHAARVRAGQDDRQEMAELAHELAQPIWRQLYFKRQAEAMDHPPIDLNEVGRRVEEEAREQSRTPWPGVIFGLFLGKSTPEAVRAAAEAGGESERPRRTCDADLYIAVHDLANDDRDAARVLLRSAAERCPAGTFEARLAKIELARLGTER